MLRSAKSFIVLSVFLSVFFFLSGITFCSLATEAGERFDFAEKWGRQEASLLYPEDALPVAGTVLVCDEGLKQYTADGVYIKQWSQGEAGKHNPSHLTASSDGKVYALYEYYSSYSILEAYSTAGDLLNTWKIDFDGTFRYISDITVNMNGDIYLVDVFNLCVLKYSPEGIRLGKWSFEGTQMTYQYDYMSAAVKPDGNILLGSDRDCVVREYTPDGMLVRQWGQQGFENGEFFALSDIAVGLSGNIYVLDSENRKVQIFSGEGEYISQWGTYGNEDSMFQVPVSIGADGDGNIYIVDEGLRIVKKFSLDGSYITSWGEAAEGELSMPASIAATANGDLLVVDSKNNNRTILRYTSGGEYIGTLEKENDKSVPNKVAVAPDGSIYFSDAGNECVYKCDANGKIISKLEGSEDMGSMLSYPSDIKIAADGSVYVLDMNGGKVFCFAADGSLKSIVAGGIYATCMAIDPEGYVYFGNNGDTSILKYNQQGERVDTFKIKAAMAEDYYMSDIVVQNNSMYILIGTKLYKYSLKGKYITSWEMKNVYVASGMVFGTDGNAFITDVKGWVCRFIRSEAEEAVVTGVTLSEHTVFLKTKKFVKLTAKVIPSNTTEDDSVVWSSSDEKVAVVDQNGKVKSLTPGVVDITATTVSGGFSDRCTVVVSPDAKFTINPKQKLQEGDKVRLSINMKGNKKDYQYRFMTVFNEEKYVDISDFWSNKNTCTWTAGIPGQYELCAKVMYLPTGEIYYYWADKITVE